MTQPDKLSGKVTKIRPSWELSHEDAEGNMFFEFTSEHTGKSLDDIMRLKKITGEKVIKEMEARMKL